MPDSRKYKRGERSSTEESPNTSKKPNMADEDYDGAFEGGTASFDADEEEPNLLEIKKFLSAFKQQFFSIS